MARPTFLLPIESGVDPLLSTQLGDAIAYFRAPKNVVARCLGVTTKTLSLMLAGDERFLQPGSKSLELARLFLYVYVGVNDKLGFNQKAASTWFFAVDKTLSARPVELIQSVVGLMSLLEHMGCKPPAR